MHDGEGGRKEGAHEALEGRRGSGDASARAQGGKENIPKPVKNGFPRIYLESRNEIISHARQHTNMSARATAHCGTKTRSF